MSDWMRISGVSSIAGMLLLFAVPGCGSSGEATASNFNSDSDASTSGGSGGASQDGGTLLDASSNGGTGGVGGIGGSGGNGGSAGDQELCGNGLDDNGDGQIDENCDCKPGDTQSCFPGKPGQAELGECKKGTQKCETSGGEFQRWGECVGAISPQPELCDKLDNDCDGTTDEGDVCGGDACDPEDVTWGDCTGHLPKAGNGTEVPVDNTASGHVGNAVFSCDNGAWKEKSGSCEVGCAAQAVQWEQCGADLPEGKDGETQTVDNTGNSQYAGSATYKCVSGSWQMVSGNCDDATNNNGCPAQSVQWDQCSGSLNKANEGETQTVNNATAGYTGSAMFKCQSGQWQKVGGTCNQNTQGCPPQNVTWGQCSGSLGTGQDGQTQQVNANSDPNYMGSASYKCNNGTWQQVSADCNKKLCSYDWTGGGQWPIHTTGPYTKIYVMLANRSPEPPGLAYWDNVGYNRQQVTAFANCNEPMGIFSGFKSPSTIVKKIYQTAFHRTPGSAEVSYWADQFAVSCSDTSKNFGCFADCTDNRLGDFVMTIYNAASGNDKKVIDNQVKVGEYWALQLVNHRCPWDDYGRTVLQQVNANASSVTAAKHGIDQKIAQMEQQQLSGSYPGAMACH